MFVFAPINLTSIRPESQSQIHWTNVLPDSRVRTRHSRIELCVVDCTGPQYQGIANTIVQLIHRGTLRLIDASNRTSSSSRGRMKAGRIHYFGPPDAIEIDQTPRPAPKEGELVVQVAAAGVGPWDALIREGKSVVRLSLPIIRVRFGWDRLLRGSRGRSLQTA